MSLVQEEEKYTFKGTFGNIIKHERPPQRPIDSEEFNRLFTDAEQAHETDPKR